MGRCFTIRIREAKQRGRENNFDTLRIGAAFAVLLSHSVPLSYGSNGLEPIFMISNGQVTLGEVALAVFFVISGYLITKSYVRSRSAPRFVLARALRLLPALATTLVLLAAVAGPLLTTERINDYFSDVNTARFVFVNVSLVDFGDGLPGVFTSNPFPTAVDGSLWTLRYEAACYLMILVLVFSKSLNKWVIVALFIVDMIASKYWVGGRLVELSSYFLGGAMMYFWHPPLRPRLAACCLLLLTIALLTHGYRLAFATVGAYVIIYAALAPSTLRLPWSNGTDVSYGIYIWAFPVQQTTSMLLGQAASWWANILIAIPVVVCLAWLSWHLVEAPALALRPTSHVAR